LRRQAYKKTTFHYAIDAFTPLPPLPPRRVATPLMPPRVTLLCALRHFDAAAKVFSITLLLADTLFEAT